MRPRRFSAAPSSRYSAASSISRAELLGELELRLDLRALAQDGLGLVVVVPEARGERRLGQIFEHAFELRDVKDAPLAPQSAF